MCRLIYFHGHLNGLMQFSDPRFRQKLDTFDKETNCTDKPFHSESVPWFRNNFEHCRVISWNFGDAHLSEADLDHLT